MKRKIIEIDEKLCNGCGDCIPNCPEGALQLIDGKARLISDLFCDGLGACIGECPLGAISTIEREAEAYDERKVMEKNIIKAGTNTIKAHLKHLKEHGEDEFFNIAISVLKEKNIPVPELEKEESPMACGCPGSAAMSINNSKEHGYHHSVSANLKSELNQWPVQLTLLNPHASYFKNADLLIAADCVPFAYPNFHDKFIKGKITVIFCPKLDTTIDQYIEKLAQIFTMHDIKSVTIVRMEVPCCGGTEYIVKQALEQAKKTMMVQVKIISIKGDIL
ncbi:MAG: 4Fe-4S binding protein [Candidatus Marinimicrobia bacterium]|jgi:NAD-dependent dihydropyrimidine dehydrogenase PreA subunit|nr:4Fe-4S binding protein [Candidatus Neomarinimicrobiota bacterium]